MQTMDKTNFSSLTISTLFSTYETMIPLVKVNFHIQVLPVKFEIDKIWFRSSLRWENPQNFGNVGVVTAF